MKKMLFALSLSGALLGGSVAGLKQQQRQLHQNKSQWLKQRMAAPAVQAVEAVAAPVEAPAPAEE